MRDRIRSKGPRQNFFIVSNDVFDLDLHPLDKLVYICLMRYSNNDTRQAFPGYKRIAQDCGISERRAITAVKSLVAMGLVVKERRKEKNGRDKSNLYTVIEPEELAGVNVVHTMGERGAPSEGERGAPTQGERGAYEKDLCFKKTYEKEGFNQFPEIDKSQAVKSISSIRRMLKGVGRPIPSS